MIAAVLTGDIVASSSMSGERLERVRNIVLESTRMISAWDKGLATGEAEFFRGDSWQFMLPQPVYLLRAVLLIRARLLAEGADSRISVGVGQVNDIDVRRISLSSGEAFTLSGQALDDFKGPGAIVAMSSRFETVRDVVSAIFHLCDALLSGWTARQAEIAGIALDPAVESHAAVVRRLGEAISVQSVGKTLRSIQFDAVMNALKLFERGLWLEQHQ